MSYDLSEAFSDLEHFFCTLIVCAYILGRASIKTSVFSAGCVVENSPSGLGFPLTQYLDILEILLLLLLGYCQEDAVCALGEYFTQSGCQMLKRRESYKFTEHSLMPVWGLLADKSQFARWNSV